LGTGGTDHAIPGLSDRVNVTGNVTLGGNLVLSDNAGANNQGSAGAGTYKLFTYTGEAGGSFSSVSGLPAYHSAVHDAATEQAIYLDVYNYAVATVTSSVDLGRIHAGGTFGTQALTVGNTTISGNFTESLGGVIATVATGITATGSVTGIAGQATNSSNMVVGISDNSAGQKNGLVGIGFTSQAVSTSGLSDTTLASQNVTVTGFAYTGQGVWDVSGSGSWGNNVDDYNNWTLAGGVAGLDGTLSANDTATFGSATSAPATVRLDGANPSLSGVTFDNANSYTLDQGSGGQLTLKGNGGAASVTDAAGSHGISAPLSLASNANVAVTNSNDTLTIVGSISGSGYGLTKSGGGVLTLSGDSTYTGATLVSQGTLLVNGTLANTVTNVSSGAILGGTGTLGGATTIESDGTHAPGNVGTPGTQTFATGVTYNSGSIFEWSLNASDSNDFTDDLGAYDKVVTPSAVAGSANSKAIFKVVLGTNHFSDVFWDTNRTWSDIFSGSGTYSLASLLPVFDGTDGSNTVSANGVVAGEGRFYYTGSSLNWSAVPEPTSALVGILLGAGLLRRRRTDEHGGRSWLGCCIFPYSTGLPADF
jgi:autotransporter-associated beta strand protein